uniref:Peptidase S1 domain-containing protein n=1 Tax=Plectus sambesii TaxID=2011161 RepID=A0A914WZM1_9BILA
MTGVSLLLVILFLFLDRCTGQATCGQQAVDPTQPLRSRILTPGVRIIGGDAAKPKAWPWQVLLQGEDSGFFSTTTYTCGATIISDRWILTAQHCISKIQKLLDTTYLYIGIHDLQDRKKSSALRISKMACHPYFDLALIMVDRQITYNDYVQPICLPASNSTLARPGTIAFVTGWGNYLASSDQVSSGISSSLLQARVPIQTCAQGYIFTNTTKYQICAGAYRTGVAEGDSGGPLQMIDENDGRWYQVGITHGVIQPMHEDVYPDIYQEVAPAISYIDACMKNISDPVNCPTRCSTGLSTIVARGQASPAAPSTLSSSLSPSTSTRPPHPAKSSPSPVCAVMSAHISASKMRRHLIWANCVIIFILVPHPEAHVRIDDGHHGLHSPVSMPDLDFLEGGLHHINVAMRIQKIFDNEVGSKTFTTTIELLLSWRDERLRHSGDAQIIHDGASLFTLWIPNFYFKNARRVDYGDQSLTMAAIARDGTVTYSTTLDIQLDCHTNGERFPFNEFNCAIELASYSKSIQQLNMSWFERHAAPLEFGKHFDARNVIGSNVSRCDYKRSYAIDKFGDHRAEYSCLRAEIRLMRPINAHLLQCFLPTVLIVISSWLGFWIDRHNVIARVTLHFVSLLTLIAHGGAMRAQLPAHAEATAIDHMFAASMVFVFCAAIEFGIVHLMMHASQKYLDLAKGKDSIRAESRIRYERLA